MAATQANGPSVAEAALTDMSFAASEGSPQNSEHSPAAQACLDRDCARQRALAWRDDLLKRYPLQFESGYLQGFTGEDATAYPDGFHSWALERRNAFFAGWKHKGEARQRHHMERRRRCRRHDCPAP